MAKNQTRKTISLNSDVFFKVNWAATMANKTTSQYITDILREHLPDLPRTRHQDRREAAQSRAARNAIVVSKREQLTRKVENVRAMLKRIEAQLEET